MLKVTIRCTDSSDKATTKTFDKLLETSSDLNLAAIAKKYAAITNAVSTTANKIVTTALNLS